MTTSETALDQALQMIDQTFKDRPELTKEQLEQRRFSNAALRLVPRPRGMVFYCHTHRVAADTHDLIEIGELTWQHRALINPWHDVSDGTDDSGNRVEFVDCEIWHYDPVTRSSSLYRKPSYWYPQ